MLEAVEGRMSARAYNLEIRLMCLQVPVNFSFLNLSGNAVTELEAIPIDYN